MTFEVFTGYESFVARKLGKACSKSRYMYMKRIVFYQKIIIFRHY